MSLADFGEWAFAAGGGVSEGFNDAALDTFQGHGVQSMVREIIQNSADARFDKSEPTTVAFSIFTTPRQDIEEVTSLAPWLQRAWDAEPPQSGEADDVAAQRHDFYANALKLLDKPSITMLAIHDFNTTGLTGETTFKPGQIGGPWWALVRSTGRNNKSSPGAGGSYGHGSKAPIAYSGLRSVLYFTQYMEEDNLVTRFQGKSILESMSHPHLDNQFTSNTGFFATGPSDQNPQPLEGDLVPSWARRDRQRFGNGQGTSVFVPLPQFETEEDFWVQAKTSLVANFAAALLDDQLVVHLGSKATVDHSSIHQALKDLPRDGLDDDVQGQLESAETVLRGSRHSDEWPGIGRVEYFFRSGDGLKSRRVGIARSLGMLITRRIDGLGPGAQYGGTEPFDLFVWIRGDEGNRLLRSLENPEHNAFEFDRIKSVAKKNQARKSFNALRALIKKLAADRFGIRVDERLPMGDLDFLLGNFSRGDGGSTGDDGDNAPAISPIHRPVSPGGGKKNNKAGAKNAKALGRKPPRGVRGVLDAAGAQVESNELMAEGFRIVPSSTHPKRAVVHINLPRTEYRFLEIYRAGETVVDDEPCLIKDPSSPAPPAQRVPLPTAGKKDRLSLTVEFGNEEDLHGPSRLVGVLR